MNPKRIMTIGLAGGLFFCDTSRQIPVCRFKCKEKLTVMNQSRYSCQSKTLGKYRHVKDAPIPEVPDTPQTGGNMPIIPIAAGLFMVVGAVVMILKKRAALKK